MAAPTSADFIRALQERGMSYEAIGRAIGRNRSLVRQVGIGLKPGRNLTGSLQALAETGELIEPPRRLNAKGRQARTRAGQGVIDTGAWGNGVVKRQAARSGSRSLVKLIRAAAESGQTVKATVAFTKNVTVGLGEDGYKSDKRDKLGPGGVTTVTLDPDDVLVQLALGKTLTQIIIEEAQRLGRIPASADVVDVVSVEVRTY